MTPRENIISKAELMKMLQCNTERLVDIEYLFHELANGDMNHKNIDRIFKEKFNPKLLLF